jgi:cyanophycin synthetase
LPLAQVPMSCAGRVPFQVENALAAAAAAWALSLPLEIIRTGLESFRGGPADAPGRFNVLHAGQATLIVDYAHNPSAVAALVEAVETFPQPQRTLVYCASNRNDDEVILMGKAIGDGFDQVLLYPDRGNNGRADGELNALLRQGLARGRRLRRVHDAQDERHAIDTALALLGPEVLVVIDVESIEESLRYIAARLAGVAGASG